MRNSHLIVVTLLMFVVAADNEANALHCWTCATSAIDGQFCRDPFKSTSLSEDIIQNAYKECAQASGLKPVCKKLKQRIDNGLVIKRGCFYRDTRDAVTLSCDNDPTPPDVVTLSCEICETDGCNGATSISQTCSLTILLVAIFTLFLKILHL